MAQFPSITNPNTCDETPVKEQIRSEFESGTVQSRAKFTALRKKWTIKWDALPVAEYDLLVTFFETYQGDEFTWTHPETGTIFTARFSDDEFNSNIPFYNHRKVDLNIEEALHVPAPGTDDITTGLVARWTLDDGTGTTATETVASNDMTLDRNSGSPPPPTWSSGKVGDYSLYFSTSATSYASVDACPISAYPFTITGWIKCTTDMTQDGCLLSICDKDSGTILYGVMMKTTGNFSIFGRNTTFYSSDSPSTYHDNLWHFFAGVFIDSTTRRLYIDNEGNVVTGTDSVALSGAVDRTAIGSFRDSSPSNYYQGYLDDLRIYNRELSASEILTIYNIYA